VANSLSEVIIALAMVAFLAGGMWYRRRWRMRMGLGNSDRATSGRATSDRGGQLAYFHRYEQAEGDSSPSFEVWVASSTRVDFVVRCRNRNFEDKPTGDRFFEYFAVSSFCRFESGRFFP